MTLKALAQSLGITLKYLFSKPVTVPYPDAPVALKPRFHGRHVLTRHPNGLEKCIGSVSYTHLTLPTKRIV